MKRSDIWFFGTIIVFLILIVLTVFLKLPIDNWVFQWGLIVTLAPYVVIKIFFKNSKVFKWLNEEVKFK